MVCYDDNLLQGLYFICCLDLPSIIKIKAMGFTIFSGLQNVHFFTFFSSSQCTVNSLIKNTLISPQLLKTLFSYVSIRYRPNIFFSDTIEHKAIRYQPLFTVRNSHNCLSGKEDIRHTTNNVFDHTYKALVNLAIYRYSYLRVKIFMARTSSGLYLHHLLFTHSLIQFKIINFG